MTPGDDGSERALEERPGQRDAGRSPRSVAARPVKAQRLRDLEHLLAELPDGIGAYEVEVRACLLGEPALIGAGSGRRLLATYAERLRELGHPPAPGTFPAGTPDGRRRRGRPRGEEPVCPDKIEVEFGVRLSTEAGAVIAESSLDGHLTVELSWEGGRAAQE